MQSAGNGSLTELSKTRRRRSQRDDNLKRLTAGAKQRLSHLMDEHQLANIISTDEASIILKSVAFHRSDCALTDVPHHFVAYSNLEAFSQQLRSRDCFKAVCSLHRQANTARHGTYNFVPFHPEHDPAIVAWSANLHLVGQGYFSGCLSASHLWAIPDARHCRSLRATSADAGLLQCCDCIGLE